MMAQSRIGGQRAAELRRLVGGSTRSGCCWSGMDVAEASWFALGCDLTGQVMLEGARLIADAAGLVGLGELVEGARARIDAELAVVGIEAAGHLQQTLAAHAAGWPGVAVRLLNPAAVAAVRKQQLNRRRRSDWLDAAAVCELLARGEGCVSRPEDTAAAALRPLRPGGKDLVDARSRLRQQCHALVDCLWPGLWPPTPTSG
ncbi:MAG: IS110 family transposase [Egibacteraceae bacterium]